MRCTFCGASKDDVTSLVAGPGVFICGGCVALAEQAIAEAGPPGDSQNRLACSFCAATDVTSLVAGPGVFICDRCVGLCTEVIAVAAH